MANASELSADDLKSLLENVASPAGLADLLDIPNMDDPSIEGYVEAAGADSVLDRVFTLMAGRLVPDRAVGESGVVQWDVTAPSGERTYQLRIADGQATSAAGSAAVPTVILKVSVPTLLRLCAGRLDGVSGFMTGKIKLTGEMIFGTKLTTWFDYS